MLTFWILFNLFVLIMLALDLGVFHRKTHAIGFKEAMGWSVFWVSLAACFSILVYYWFGRHKALEFVTGYLIEESLSVDNLFVFLLIFRYFRVDLKYQHKVLFWGIIGALIARGVFIAAGVALITRFHWIIYVFGAFLIYTGFKMFTSLEKDIHPERGIVVRLAQKYLRFTSEYDNGKFFTMQNGKRLATPLFMVLLAVETTDILFAVDSIPAILAITADPFIVYTSNVFAILGLRSLYFALAGMMEIFRFLPYGLATILIFIGAKMAASDYVKVPIIVALAVVAGVLATSVAASLIFPKRRAPDA
ncbi:MAG: TerC family protein [Acidobacteriales bacterium]|nr:TerC family protein [Terriglobales bacterium]